MSRLFPLVLLAVAVIGCFQSRPATKNDLLTSHEWSLTASSDEDFAHDRPTFVFSPDGRFEAKYPANSPYRYFTPGNWHFEENETKIVLTQSRKNEPDRQVLNIVRLTDSNMDLFRDAAANDANSSFNLSFSK